MHTYLGSSTGSKCQSYKSLLKIMSGGVPVAMPTRVLPIRICQTSARHNRFRTQGRLHMLQQWARVKRPHEPPKLRHPAKQLLGWFREQARRPAKPSVEASESIPSEQLPQPEGPVPAVPVFAVAGILGLLFHPSVALALQGEPLLGQLPNILASVALAA
ncbi:hypothetical protein CYMTET_55928 [Cymbomonas tetramitiformis]|uniref:Uncharacterized protein n=1 Tax=Cymbomonas tetramitiformis TaxID=36881 RepID=A0AAE0EMH4_9CHLO|nr:hypothetical protein CYMTET_55928 [Cymbomonas tetramitiformis]